MNKKDWFNKLDLADDKFIDEANPDKVVKIKSRRRTVIKSVLASCACLMLVACSMWLFIPFRTTPPDVSKHADSEYYSLIEKLNVATFQKPRYKNNAQKLLAGIKNLSTDIMGGATMDDGLTNALPESYEEITDNQVSGIVEADLIKRSSTHIYYLDGNTLRIYSISEKSLVSTYTIASKNNYSYKWELYLSDDCKTVTVIAQDHITGSYNPYVKLIALDVSDPTNITKKDEFRIKGNYTTSRKTDGYILLMTKFTVYSANVDFSNEATFLPQIDEGDGYYSIPASGIIAPEELTNARYTVVLKLDESTLDLMGTAAYLSYSENVYVSEDHVFLTHTFTDKTENEDGTYTRNSMTTISCLTYGGDTFEAKGNATVRGYVKDQWSMDEYNGILRIFTTTNTVKAKKTTYNHGIYRDTTPTTSGASTNASLYCIDLSTFEVAASVIDFAPPGEQVRSVRFDKETAYVCTSIQLSDPVFFFDLSDLNSITYKDTGTIEGFSTSLINLGNGYLLGIGRGDRWDVFKVEVYEETTDGVRAVDSYELSNTEYSSEYKSYYINREYQVVGIPVRNYYHYTYEESFRYIVLQFDGYELIEMCNVPLNGDLTKMRGVLIDGCMYMFGENDFKTYQIFY